MLRDVLGIATLAETTAEISALADVLIEEALREARAAAAASLRHAAAMDARRTRGRCALRGAVAGQAGRQRTELQLRHRPAVSLRRRRGAGRSGDLQSRILHPPGAANHGDCWRGIRAKGRSFASICACVRRAAKASRRCRLPHAIQYYSHVAHDWELQAMIKARHSAGDVGLAREFMRARRSRMFTGRS